MVDQPITMKDIAAELGVSVNTVHKAVTDKPGVSDATRRRILDFAAQHGYQRNIEASALRRKEVMVSVCLPALSGDSQFFYGPLRQGVQEYVEERGAKGIRISVDEYEEGRVEETLAGIVRRAQSGEAIAGLLTVPPRSKEGVSLLEQLIAGGTLVVFASGDDSSVRGRYGAVLADFDTAGAMMAEQASNLLGRAGGRILLMAGDAYKDSHYRVARSLHEQLERTDDGFRVFDLHGYHDGARLEADLRRELEAATPDLICCVFARGSAVLRRVLAESGLAREIPVIASDLFDESIAGLEDGTFTNLIFKDPRRQGYLAMAMLGDRLLQGVDPEARVHLSEVTLVMRSNLKYYR